MMEESNRVAQQRTGTPRKLVVFLSLLVALVTVVFFHSRRLTPPRPDLAEGSVVLIVVDTLRADHLGVYGYSRATSPHLDVWSKTGRVYDNAFSSSSWTLPSFVSMLSGQTPVEHGAGARTGEQQFTQVRPEVPLLTERMKSQGYATGAFVANPFLHPVFGLQRGFDTYLFMASPAGWRSERADKVVDRAIEWVDQHGDRPFFLLVHIMDPHLPYDAPPPYRHRFSRDIPSRFSLPADPFLEYRLEGKRFAPNDIAFLAAAYDEEIAFVDEQLERLRVALLSHGVIEKGLVIFTADHGEEFFEHDGYEHGHAMWQEVIHVPLIVWGRGVHPGREEAPVSLIDLPSTVTEATGGVPFDGSQGISLWANATKESKIQARTLYAQGTLYGSEKAAVIDWPFKLIARADKDDTPLFDLGLDPGESSDVSKAHAAIHRILAKSAAESLHRMTHKSEVHEAAPIDADTHKQLKALGYIE